jgi:hypothetical protein
MPKMSFDPAVKDVLDSFILENVEIEPGKAFGLPAYYVNGKMFAAVYGEGATIKVPEETASELLELENIEPFRPMERHTMKNWLLIRHDDPEDFRGDRELFQAAFEYVYVLSKEKTGKGKVKKGKKS